MSQDVLLSMCGPQFTHALEKLVQAHLTELYEKSAHASMMSPRQQIGAPGFEFAFATLAEARSPVSRRSPSLLPAQKRKPRTPRLPLCPTGSEPMDLPVDDNFDSKGKFVSLSADLANSFNDERKDRLGEYLPVPPKSMRQSLSKGGSSLSEAIQVSTSLKPSKAGSSNSEPREVQESSSKNLPEFQEFSFGPGVTDERLALPNAPSKLRDSLSKGTSSLSVAAQNNKEPKESSSFPAPSESACVENLNSSPRTTRTTKHGTSKTTKDGSFIYTLNSFSLLQIFNGSYEYIFTNGKHASAAEIPRQGFAKFVSGSGFEAFFAFLILLNTVTISLESQYGAFEIGYNLGYPLFEPSEKTWPHARTAFDVAELLFGILFLIELIVKLAAFGISFCYSGWNVLDAIIVAIWLITKTLQMDVGNPMLLRLARLARVLRILRMFKTLTAMDSLQVLIKSIQHSLSALIWCACLLSVMITATSLFVHHLVVWYLEDDSIPLEDRHKVFEYFGTFARTALSVFEVTLGNFAVVMRALTENVNMQWGWFFLTYKCVGGFTVVTVITGVFLQETFHIANSDDDLLMIRQKRQTQKHVSKMSRLFEAADRTGQGHISYDDFLALVSDPFIKTWLAAYGLEARDATLLFRLLDDGDGTVTAEELVNGVSRLKGTARSVDMHTTILELGILKKAVIDVYERLLKNSPMGGSLRHTPSDGTSNGLPKESVPKESVTSSRYNNFSPARDLRRPFR